GPLRDEQGCQACDRRFGHPPGSRQRGRLQDDDQQLSLAVSVRGDELNSLYVEPERHEREIAWAALEFVDVFKIFRSGPVETVALRGLRLRVEHGELVAVLGPSGCGKTTMLSLAAALDQPSAGEVRVGEHPLGRLDEEALADFRAREVAIVFQRDNLWPWLT